MAKLPRAAAPGTIWNYSTGETFVAGAVVRSAVGRPLAQYLSERIWTKAGMEADATWWLESPDGMEIGGSGLSATLRDYGRFGLFLMNGGVARGEKILPDGWVREAGSRKTIGGKVVDYGYLTWPFAAAPGAVNDGAFQALGIYGQHIYVNPRGACGDRRLGRAAQAYGERSHRGRGFFRGRDCGVAVVRLRAAGFAETAANATDFRAQTTHSSASSRISAGTA